MNFQPLNDNILVKISSTEEQTAGGIIIPDTAKPKEDVGEVVAVPPGGGEEVAVGDRVMFKGTSVTELTEGDDLYVVVPFKDLLGKYTESDKI